MGILTASIRENTPPRTLAVAEALSAQQNLDQAMEAASTAAMGFKAGVSSWVSDMVEVQGSSGIILYMICQFLLESGRGWKDGMLWKWNCWCSCFVPFINAGYLFPTQCGCLSNTKESGSIPCLSLSICLWCLPFERTYPIHLSIYPARSIYIHLCPSIHVSI